MSRQKIRNKIFLFYLNLFLNLKIMILARICRDKKFYVEKETFNNAFNDFTKIYQTIER